MEFRRGAYQTVSRGGKGFEAVKRASFTRVVPPPIELVDWEQVEGKVDGAGNGKRTGNNGDQGEFFNE